jgi:pyridoxamine 5'-phosphate oxidase
MSKTRMAAELAAMRVSYERQTLDESDLAATWHEQLLRWLGEATQSGLAEPAGASR